MRNPLVLAVALVAVVVSVTGCGGDDGAGDLSPLAATGRETARTAGCTSCHGTDGEAGVGPAWAGVAGADVELDDGTIVVADDEYLRRSIIDPGIEVVAGFTATMPPNRLSEAEVDALVAYIREL